MAKLTYQKENRQMSILEPITLSIESGACLKSELPKYESHSRGTNFAAVIGKDPTSPGGLSREFLPKAHGEYAYMVSGLKPGDALEIAGDYTSGGGKRTRSRWYGIVTKITGDLLELQEYSTHALAIQEGKRLAELAEAPAASPELDALKAEKAQLLARLAEIDAILCAK